MSIVIKVKNFVLYKKMYTDQIVPIEHLTLLAFRSDDYKKLGNSQDSDTIRLVCVS